MNRLDNPDVRFRSSDNHLFSLHSAMLQLRWPFYKRDPQLAITKISSLKSSQISSIIEYIYGGLPAKEKMKNAFQFAEVPFPTNNSIKQYKSDMNKLLSTGLNSDFKITSHGTKFSVHKFVLAIRSGYFCSLFESGLTEVQKCAENDAFSDSSIHMRQFLEYLYSGETNLSSVDDCFSLLNLCKTLYLYENYEGEVEEYVVSYILTSHSSMLNEITARASSKQYNKLVDLIKACEQSSS